MLNVRLKATNRRIGILPWATPSSVAAAFRRDGRWDRQDEAILFPAPGEMDTAKIMKQFTLTFHGNSVHRKMLFYRSRSHGNFRSWRLCLHGRKPLTDRAWRLAAMLDQDGTRVSHLFRL